MSTIILRNYETFFLAFVYFHKRRRITRLFANNTVVGAIQKWKECFSYVALVWMFLMSMY